MVLTRSVLQYNRNERIRFEYLVQTDQVRMPHRAQNLDLSIDPGCSTVSLTIRGSGTSRSRYPIASNQLDRHFFALRFVHAQLDLAKFTSPQLLENEVIAKLDLGSMRCRSKVAYRKRTGQRNPMLEQSSSSERIDALST